MVPLPSLVALAYALGCYVTGVRLLISPHLPANIGGVLLTSHALICAAYLLHDFAHGTIFRGALWNQIGGEFMGFICGSCYSPFSSLRRKHLRHHADRADVVAFDYKAFLRSCPAAFRQWLTSRLQAVLLCEWAYIPAVEYIMHCAVIILPLVRHRGHLRVLAVAALRLPIFAWLAWHFPRFVPGYFLAYTLMIHVLRFVDCYQHTYDAFLLSDDVKIPTDKVRDRKYEQDHTFSNLVSESYPLLNLFILNFGYHNAHHEKVTVPWHALPAEHARLYPGSASCVVPFSRLARAYHRDRVTRILAQDYGEVNGADLDKFLGAVGVSFLTAC